MKAQAGCAIFALAIPFCTPLIPAAMAGVDSGGGASATPSFNNRCSIGEPVATGAAAAGGAIVLVGLIEVLYPPLRAVDDSDGNGLPDQWELDHFNHIGVDPEDDADKDGTTNAMEFLAMTDPNDPQSVFRPACYRDGNVLILPIQTQSGRHYHIWGGPDLHDWTLLDTLEGSGAPVQWEYLLDDPGALPYFLRIEISIP